jgi:hypothetical protein
MPISGSGKHPTLENHCQTFKTKSMIPKTWFENEGIIDRFAS